MIFILTCFQLVNIKVFTTFCLGAPSFNPNNPDAGLQRNKSDETVGNGTENSEHKVCTTDTKRVHFSICTKIFSHIG